jgi:hypothetical protein
MKTTRVVVEDDSGLRRAALHRWTPWLAFGSALAAAVAGLWLTWSLRATPLPGGMDLPRGSSYVCWLLFAAIGAALLLRRPGNVVGWLLLATSLLWQLHGLAGSYRAAALLQYETWPAAEFAAWLWEWAWAPGVLVVFALPLLFPDGRLPSRRWRPVPVLLAVGTLATVAAVALRPGGLPSTPSVANPFGIDGAGGLLDGFELVGTAAFSVGAVASLLAPVVRHRRAGDVERHQLLWFATAVVIILLAWLAATALEAAGADPELLADIRLLPLVLLPIAIAIAIGQYRLYDIDVVVHRGLVYGALALFIGAVYVTVVLGVGQLVGARTGHVPLTLGATVVTAVAFAPLRARLQGFADRVVYGRRESPYDALASVTSRISGVSTGRGVLDAIARTAAEAVGASRGEVWLRSAAGLERAACWPDDVSAHHRPVVPLPTDNGAEVSTVPPLMVTAPLVEGFRAGPL